MKKILKLSAFTLIVFSSTLVAQTTTENEESSFRLFGRDKWTNCETAADGVCWCRDHQSGLHIFGIEFGSGSSSEFYIGDGC